ncbi:hypothetical protein EDD22DRAFT_787801, partial [Suillus occidentalis]
TSPYGRSHVFKQRLPKLLNPVVRHFFLRSCGRLTYIIALTNTLDVRPANHPLWNTAQRLNGAVGEGGAEDEECEGTVRLGCFKRRVGQ